jgi:two-component system, NtrC family, response regulator AtoC
MGKKVIVAHDDLDLKCLHTAAGGWSVKTAGGGDEALTLIQRFRNVVVAAVVDLDLPGDDGVAVLRRLRMAYPELPVVALTCPDQPAETAEALGAGATECAFKPIVHEELVRILQRITTSEAVCRCESPGQAAGHSQFLHLNPEMRAIQQSLRMLAPWNVPVIFIGDTGVGKEVAARQLHQLSTRAHKPFIKINCAAVPSELLESELFGYEKGAFTGALRSKPGKFELADRGTVLLDEIGDMHSNLQAKLLQVLQDGEFDRLGGRQTVRVDVRVLAATHRDLRRAVETGAFREDLFYRLNVATILIPPLRERKDEIIPLAEQFIVKHGTAVGTQTPEIPKPLRQALVDYAWPGNVRELENVIRKFLVFRQPDALAAELWKRMAERKQAPGNTAAPKMSPAPAPAASAVRNGSNGAGEKTLSPGNGFGNGTAAGFANPAGLHITNGSHNGGPVETEMSHQDGFFALLDHSNGKSGAPQPDYEHPTLSRQERPEQVMDGVAASPDSSPGYDCSDDLDLDGTAGNGASKNLENGGAVSTLAQVEELSKEFERRTILAALQRSTWNRKKAAKMLDIDYKGLLYKMKKLQIA